MFQSMTCLLLLVNLVCSENVDYVEGSGDVCNVEGSSCPEGKCCRPDKCKKEASELKCCDDPNSENTCSPCPTCGKYRAIVTQL